MGFEKIQRQCWHDNKTHQEEQRLKTVLFAWRLWSWLVGLLYGEELCSAGSVFCAAREVLLVVCVFYILYLSVFCVALPGIGSSCLPEVLE